LGDGAIRSFRVGFLKAQNSLQQGKEQGISQRFSAKICLETSANAGANRSARPDEAFTRAIASAQQLPSRAASAALVVHGLGPGIQAAPSVTDPRRSAPDARINPR
jgi:hypothetical protein